MRVCRVNHRNAVTAARCPYCRAKTGVLSTFLASVLPVPANPKPAEATQTFEYYDNGSVRREAHFRGLERHCDDGPAVVWYHVDGSVERETYFRDDLEVSKEEALRHHLATLYPEMPADNTAAVEWLEPHVRQDPETRAFIPPDPNLVAVALSMFENPAARSRS